MLGGAFLGVLYGKHLLLVIYDNREIAICSYHQLSFPEHADIAQRVRFIWIPTSPLNFKTIFWCKLYV